jgi:hypothetical protein
MYTPILRNRQSEMLAVQALDSDTKAWCFPLIDVAEPTKGADVAASAIYVQNNSKRLVRALKGFERVLVDSSELDPSFRIGGTLHPLTLVAKAASEAGAIPTPVTGLHRDAAHHEAVMQIMAGYHSGQLCVRFDATDIRTASLSCNRLVALLSHLSVESAQTILLLDCQSVFGKEPATISAELGRMIIACTKLPLRSIIVAGYGIPDKMSEAVAVREQDYIPRLEQDLFHDIAWPITASDHWFGDYTTLSPVHVELDWKVMSKVMGPKAIYALDDSWFVVRGGPFSTHHDGYAQYYDLASSITALDEFSGPDFSFGDEYINDCANRVGKAGSPASWIKACVNHHITFTARAHAF